MTEVQMELMSEFALAGFEEFECNMGGTDRYMHLPVAARMEHNNGETSVAPIIIISDIGTTRTLVNLMHIDKDGAFSYIRA